MKVLISWEYNFKLSRGYFTTKKFLDWFYACVNKKSQWEFSLRCGYKPHIIKLWLYSPSCFINLPEQNQIITNSVDLWPCAAPPPFLHHKFNFCKNHLQSRLRIQSFPLRVDTKGRQLLFGDCSTNSPSNFFSSIFHGPVNKLIFKGNRGNLESHSSWSCPFCRFQYCRKNMTLHKIQH